MAFKRILLISGAIHAGKSLLAAKLHEANGFVRISSRQYLAGHLPEHVDPTSEAAREQLQEIGDRLDKETDFRWIVESVASQQIAAAPHIENWLIDAVRKARQVQHFRAAFSAVRHVHLTAPESILIARHQESAGHYAKAIAHPNEISSRSLGTIADLTIDTSMHTPDDLCDLVMTLWGK